MSADGFEATYKECVDDIYSDIFLTASSRALLDFWVSIELLQNAWNGYNQNIRKDEMSLKMFGRPLCKQQ